VKVNGIEVVTAGKPKNDLSTTWGEHNVSLSRGMDFLAKKGDILAKITHLQHEAFSYNIKVNYIFFKCERENAYFMSMNRYIACVVQNRQR